MKLKFKTDGIVSGEVVFKAGETYEISNDKGSADRWIKRGAEVVTEAPKEEVVVKATKEEVVIEAPKKENKTVKEKKPSKGE